MSNPALTLPRPTRVRYLVLTFLCSMAFVLYLDRVCIAQALVPMKAEFDMSNTQASAVLMAFTLAYGLFEIPTGRWGDRFGSRRVLTRIVLWWSVFTALTGCVPIFELDLAPLPWIVNGFGLLLAIRFLFGAGEAGAVPNAARIMKRWFPNSERGLTQGLFQASMHVGGAVAPVLAARIIDAAGWRWTFGIFGIVGVAWAALFYWWFRDSPDEHPAVNQAEMQWIGTPAHPAADGHGGVPWREVLCHPNIWFLSAIITMTAFNSYFFFSWYSTYLQEARKLDNEEAGWLAALALAGATVGSLLGGYVADLITRRAANGYRARRRFCLASMCGAAASLFGSVLVDVPIYSGLLCALACLLMFCPMPTWWSVAFEVTGKHPGSLFGLLNSMGIIGALSSQFFFGAFADWRKTQGFEGRDQWDPAFYLPTALLLIAALLWQFVYPRRAIGEGGTCV